MGVPPIYGLYACLVPLILYALFGSSRQLSIGPVAVTAILVMSGVSQLAHPFSDEFVELVLKEVVLNLLVSNSLVHHQVYLLL